MYKKFEKRKGHRRVFSHFLNLRFHIYELTYIFFVILTFNFGNHSSNGYRYIYYLIEKYQAAQMNNDQLLLSFKLKTGSNRGDPSWPFTYLWLLPSSRIKVIIFRKEIKVVNKEYQCFFFSRRFHMFLTPQKILSTQFLALHVPYDKCLEPKPINAKKTPFGLIGLVLTTIKRP